MRFFDSNVLVYAVDPADSRKRKIAIDMMTHSLEINHEGAISTQVMSEFVNVVLKKGIAHLDTLDKWISLFYPLLETEVTMDIVRNAVEIKKEYGIQFYDAQIIATAEKLGCTEIVTEDLNDGQLYHGMVAVNPFKRSPAIKRSSAK